MGAGLNPESQLKKRHRVWRGGGECEAAQPPRDRTDSDPTREIEVRLLQARMGEDVDFEGSEARPREREEREKVS